MVLVTRKIYNMPLTVITIKNAPLSLRGDLTKWMQEIATGVYVGNFNARVREKLWDRVQASIGKGEATISYAYRNEIGYQFETMNTQRKVLDFDGIPLVQFPIRVESDNSSSLGYSNVSKYRRIKHFSKDLNVNSKSFNSYVVVDIETDGLDENRHAIIEIGAVKVTSSGLDEFSALVNYSGTLPTTISKLTGISQDLLEQEGQELRNVLTSFLQFIGNSDLVGYGINFDIKFINNALKSCDMLQLGNKTHDIMKFVKREKLYLENYKLQTVLASYGIDKQVPHRALQDARLIYELSTKVNKFLKIVNRK